MSDTLTICAKCYAALTPRIRCDACGKYVKASDPRTKHVMTQPDCAFGGEEWETLCADCDKSPDVNRA